MSTMEGVRPSSLPPRQHPDLAVSSHPQDFQERLFNGLQQVHDQVSLLPSQVDQLPEKIRQVVREELGSTDSRAVLSHHAGTVVGQEKDAALIAELQAKCHSLQTFQAENSKTITDLQKQLASKTRDLKKLHKVIIEMGQSEPEISDEDIVSRFGSLKFSIEQTARRHFPPRRVSRFKSYTNIAGDAGKDVWPRIFIADRLQEGLFCADVFGLSKDKEKVLLELEKKLNLQAKKTHNFESKDVLDWRVRTVRLTKCIDSKSREHRFEGVAEAIFAELQEFVPSRHSKELDEVYTELSDICKLAFELAMDFRSSKIQYRWHHEVSTPPKAALDSGANRRPSPVLFGAVEKYVDGQWEVLREAEINGTPW